MPRRSENLIFATNFAKRQLTRVDSETERRRWFDRFIVLAGLVKIEIKDEPTGQGPEPIGPTLDEQAAAIVKKLNGGDDVSTD